MRPIDLVRIAIHDLRSSKLRTLLTGLGVIIGVASVTLLLSLGEGVRAQIGGAFTDLGTTRILVGAASTAAGPGAPTITLDDLAAIEALPPVLDAAPVLPSVAAVTALAQGASAPAPAASGAPAAIGRMSVVGTTPAYFAVAGTDLIAGAPFGAGSVVIDDVALPVLFGPGADAASAIGRGISISGTAFTVSGVARNPLAAIAAGMSGGSGSGGQDAAAASASLATVYRDIAPMMAADGQRFVAQVQLRAKDATRVEEARTAVRDLLYARHGAADVSVTSLARILSQVSDALSVITGFLAALAGISLLVGGIGIMNIMLAAVAERTREIGIIRALGASRGAVTAQFMAEAVAVSLIGGVIGLGLAFAGTIVAQSVLDIPSAVSPGIIALAVGVSTLVGVGFGVLPAYRAARLDPIRALRHD
jgi:putative ABC transport system permease protein